MIGWEIAVGLLKRFWPYILVAVGVAGYTAAIYHAGGVGPRAELAKEKAEHQATADRLKAEQQQDEEQSNAFIAELEADHQEQLAQAHGDWSNWVADLCPGGVGTGGVCNGPSGGAAKKPVPIVAGVCDDAAQNDRLSNALSSYRDEVQRTIAGERAETSHLLETCQAQTGALVQAQKWALGEQLIHGTGTTQILLH